jgi:hypothetical protein
VSTAQRPRSTRIQSPSRPTRHEAPQPGVRKDVEDLEAYKAALLPDSLCGTDIRGRLRGNDRSAGPRYVIPAADGTAEVRAVGRPVDCVISPPCDVPAGPLRADVVRPGAAARRDFREGRLQLNWQRPRSRRESQLVRRVPSRRMDDQQHRANLHRVDAVPLQPSPTRSVLRQP